jgi:hypothetical protein
MEQFRPEDSYVSALEYLFGPRSSQLTQTPPEQVAHAFCDALFEAYHASLNDPLRPGTYADYIERVRPRMEEAALRDEAILPSPLGVVGPAGRCSEYQPWQGYFGLLKSNRNAVDAHAPTFSTFARGDPNPENVLLREHDGHLEVKFIDPKDWGEGDYIFDLTKFAHYLEVTGPAQLAGDGAATASKQGGKVEVSLRFAAPGWVGGTVQVLRDRAKSLAEAKGDTTWEPRWDLGMAFNLLGLPGPRLAKGQRALALAAYACGMAYLDQFCVRAGLQPRGTASTLPA